ncbi:MAG: LuxR C-terminal-related transcriptional regulator [Bernardetiaceae bacterium]|jgi:DNA-binding CsgD family transcriptional regulator|nr:LuxR C-terminal-related transcriptional regulator [Bernardetiaceae bacterium]
MNNPSVAYLCGVGASGLGPVTQVLAQSNWLVLVNPSPETLGSLGAASNPQLIFLGMPSLENGYLDKLRLCRQRFPACRLVVMAPPALQTSLGEQHLLRIDGFLPELPTDHQVWQCLSLEAGLLPPPNLVPPPSLPKGCDLRLLTRTERQVLDLIAKGLRASAIAEVLCRSYHTIKNHKANIVEKWGLKGVEELYEVAKMLGK